MTKVNKDIELNHLTKKKKERREKIKEELLYL
jgi:hypothetical protein